MNNSESNTKPADNNKIRFSIDTRIIILALIVIICGMLAVWKPWQNAPVAEDRTITVSGEAKITQEPDEYIFNPSYQFKDTSKEAALVALTKKNEEMVSKLKALGVTDSKIKTDSNGYNYDYYYDSAEQKSTYSLRMTVTVNNKDLAQKVQDYLLETGPTGQVTPQANFSDAKRKEIENKARDEATKDARAKADQSARNLGFKVGKVKSINDGDKPGSIQTLNRGGAKPTVADDTASPSLGLQPGEDNLNYSVTVVYYVK